MELAQIAGTDDAHPDFIGICFHRPLSARDFSPPPDWLYENSHAKELEAEGSKFKAKP
jgi:hypothetical protein